MVGVESMEPADMTTPYERGGLRHTIRHADGSWHPFGNVESEAGNMVAIGVECAAVNGELHVCAVNDESSLWHTIRHADGSWHPFGNVNQQTGNRGRVRGIACADVKGELHVCAGNGDYGLWHTIRYANGGWQTLKYIKDPYTSTGNLIKAWTGDLACAAINGELHLCLEDYSGLLHTIRHADGRWLALGDVKRQAGIGNEVEIVSVACAAVNGELHVCAATHREYTVNFEVHVEGGLWHTIRKADGRWLTFGDVKGQAGDRGPVKSQTYGIIRETVACAAVKGELHVCAVNSDGSLWHTIRHADGSWEPFRNVGEAVGDRRYIDGVALANVNNELHVCILTNK
jgi:hypothetical protein